MTNSRGFTLLEVLVALTIVAVALAALVRIGGTSSLNAARLEEKSFANWVALNRMEELRLAADWPTPGSASGTEEMGGRVWRWTQTVQSTDDDHVRKVEIAVALDDDPKDSVITLVGFVGQPPLAPAAATPG